MVVVSGPVAVSVAFVFSALYKRPCAVGKMFTGACTKSCAMYIVQLQYMWGCLFCRAC